MALPTTPDGWKMAAEAFDELARQRPLRYPQTDDMRQMLDDLGIEPVLYEQSIYMDQMFYVDREVRTVEFSTVFRWSP